MENIENVENMEKYNKYILKPGNVLCFILEPKYWEMLNEIRKNI